MKKVVFIAILLIGLGAAWTLYLEHGNKRFADNLPKAPATTQQPANTSEVPPTVGDKNNQTVVGSVSAEITAENARVWHEHAGPHPQSEADTPDTAKSPTDTSLTKDPTQTSSDSNPVPPEVIADSRRDLEWYQAMKEYERKFDALRGEWDELNQEFDSITSGGLEDIQRMGDREKTAYIAKLKAWKAKVKVWEKKDKELEQERPIRPTPTHTH